MTPILVFFYLSAAIAVIASIKVITRTNTVHALLYLVVSLLAVAVCFYLMGAPFAAGLEVIVYAGAILVLFVFAIMMFGLRQDELKYAPQSTGKLTWLGPFTLAFILLFELVWVLNNDNIMQYLKPVVVPSKEVGKLLFSEYLLVVELASFLLLAGLIAGFHFARPDGTGGHK